jgi:hypothetical protein
MLITSVMTLVCTAGIAFYLRFLVALCKECKPRWLGFSKYLRPFSGSYSVPMLAKIEKGPVPQQTGKLPPINLGLVLESREEIL